MLSWAQHPTQISVSSRTFFVPLAPLPRKSSYTLLMCLRIIGSWKTSKHLLRSLLSLISCIRTWFMMAHGSIATRKKPRLWLSPLFLSGNQNDDVDFSDIIQTIRERNSRSATTEHLQVQTTTASTNPVAPRGGGADAQSGCRQIQTIGTFGPCGMDCVLTVRKVLPNGQSRAWWECE